MLRDNRLEKQQKRASTPSSPVVALGQRSLSTVKVQLVIVNLLVCLCCPLLLPACCPSLWFVPVGGTIRFNSWIGVFLEPAARCPPQKYSASAGAYYPGKKEGTFYRSCLDVITFVPDAGSGFAACRTSWRNENAIL